LEDKKLFSWYSGVILTGCENNKIDKNILKKMIHIISVVSWNQCNMWFFTLVVATINVICKPERHITSVVVTTEVKSYILYRFLSTIDVSIVTTINIIYESRRHIISVITTMNVKSPILHRF